MLSFALFVALSAASLTRAQQTAWEQCGGQGWTGGTVCVSGYQCIVSNPYYSQCLPAASTTSSIPTASTPQAPPAPTGSSKVNYWFSFGDSYTQTGFNVTTGPLPSVGNPFGNPPYPGYTAVGGTNWLDVATVQYNTSLVLTWNYAYGGATIDSSLVAPYEPTVLSMTDQVNSFLATAADKPAAAPWTSANTLFSFWIGINDIGNSYYESGDRSAFSDTLMSAYFALVAKIYAVGGRNFLFINVPPVDRSPLMLAQSASAQATEKTVIAGFNSKLAANASAFEAANSGVKTWVFDANTAFTTVLNSPTTYGFIDATSYGATGDFWGNNLHPSSPAQDIFGQEIAALMGNTVW
ncbi:carbohydrate esterase family 16 protein [Ramaria rubella]|nr:carbohydrate esterase family 16 protein [Ramaria rubella]